MDIGGTSQAVSAYMTRVYGWMLAGVLITALTSWFVLDSEVGFRIVSSGLFFPLIIAEFVLVFAISGWVMKMSSSVAALCFLAYSFLNGLTLSVILSNYTGESIVNTFVTVAVMFGALSLYGLTTKRNLSAIGQFMFMGLIGLVVASVLNIFIASSGLNFIINIIGVIVFSGLTVYDNQKIRENFLEYGGELASKTAILGALTLYLDFINLFLFILRLLGRRD
ncbi:MAG: Bax inhibitor-1/YccA family protein [Candidatus Kapabacteria bacterium]|nr:Bax inhibitor-1/YccA family protein [Candidatus Kapabacteria bacterium]